MSNRKKVWRQAVDVFADFEPAIVGSKPVGSERIARKKNSFDLCMQKKGQRCHLNSQTEPITKEVVWFANLLFTLAW
jgi:hypothetical protein